MARKPQSPSPPEVQDLQRLAPEDHLRSPGAASVEDHEVAPAAKGWGTGRRAPRDGLLVARPAALRCR
eukprot:11432507-Alexandrium_andersonii.AAC.1